MTQLAIELTASFKECSSQNIAVNILPEKWRHFHKIFPYNVMMVPCKPIFISLQTFLHFLKNQEAVHHWRLPKTSYCILKNMLPLFDISYTLILTLACMILFKR